jgi:hypothetical protein
MIKFSSYFLLAVLQFCSMVKRNSAKILSILMGLTGGLVVIFFILASLFPDLDLPTLSDLLKQNNNQENNLEQVIDHNENALESIELIADEAKLIALTATEDNTQAWELLINNHQIIYQEYDSGIFLEGIDGLKSDQQHFWAIYVNGGKSELGISDTILNEGDLLELKYEAIEESFN